MVSTNMNTATKTRCKKVASASNSHKEWPRENAAIALVTRRILITSITTPVSKHQILQEAAKNHPLRKISKDLRRKWAASCKRSRETTCDTNTAKTAVKNTRKWERAATNTTFNKNKRTMWSATALVSLNSPSVAVRSATSARSHA